MVDLCYYILLYLVMMCFVWLYWLKEVGVVDLWVVCYVEFDYVNF